MIEYPTPTRAEVADVSDVVRQRADALMLSGESAAGAHPVKAVDVLRAVATHSEEWVRTERHGVFDCKPLQFVWAKFEGAYDASNTVMLDDLR